MAFRETRSARPERCSRGLRVAHRPEDRCRSAIDRAILYPHEKSKESESAPGKTAGDDLVNRFTQAAAGATTTSGSATLSILQVPPTSSSLVFTNVVLKGGAPSAE